MKYLLLLACIFLPVANRAQNLTARIYTVEDGLPNNNLNSVVQDSRGFIWIATEHGLARFDGARFRHYDVADGLPDNEITALGIDAEGGLWALPYRECPAVYNALTDRFEQQKIESPAFRQAGKSIDILEGGGIALNASTATLVMHNKGDHYVDLSAHNKSAKPPQITVFLGPDKYLLVSADSFRIFDKGRFAGAQPAFLSANARTVYVNHALYYCDVGGICKTALTSTGGVRQLCNARMSLHASRLVFTGRHLALISENGTTASLIDTGTLAEVSVLPLNGALAKDVLEDRDGNVWIATIGQGLIKLSQHAVASYTQWLPADMAPGTIAIDGNTLLCGDNKGRIAIFKKGCLENILNISRWSKAVSRIRSILVVKDGYYIAVEGDASLLLDKAYNIVSVFNRPLLNFSDRCAALWHDSVILAGGHTKAVRLDYKACHSYDTAAIRTTAIAVDGLGRMLIGSSAGYYRRDDTGLHYFGNEYPQLANRVSAICTTPDGLVWIGLAASYIVALRGDKIAGVIPLNQQLPGTICNVLRAGRAGELWIGTDAALSRLAYMASGRALEWRATSFGTMDGIRGQIADIAWQRDSVYVATSSGVFVLPAGLQPAVREIPVYITGIRINDRDTFLRPSWVLPYQQNNLDIRFSGIDMSGYLPNYEYRINNEPWQDAGGDHLPLKRLSPGNYRIQIRALKRDGTPSARIASLQVYLRTPFWMSPWFYLVLFALLLVAAAAMLHYFFRRKRARQLRRITAEHELVTSQQQTFSALMNPHFIFNALNSIQHYVLAQDKHAANRYLSGFGRLIRMNFESAQKSYISLDEELERLQLYLSLEKMRFGEQLIYSIEVAEDIVPEDWQIPAMIIQPYLENALLHGIAPAAIAGRLDIRISRQEDALLVTITDNGIGFEHSQQLKRHGEHASRSMELIRKRVAVLRKLRKGVIDISISNANDADPVHPGTRVLMVFPDAG